MNYELVLEREVDGLAERRWTFTPPAIVGRDPSASVCIAHHSISRRHCQLLLNGDGTLFVKDLNSMNGIYVDENRVQQAKLRLNQVIQIGAVRLQIEEATEDEYAETPVQLRGNVDTTQPMESYQPENPAQRK